MSETLQAEVVHAESTALVAQDHDSPMPVFSGQQMAQAFTAYRELQATLDRSMPDQIMTIRGHAFRKKGYWRTIRTAFGLSVGMLTERREELPDGDWGYLVTYRATAPNGRYADGDGACYASEKAQGQDSIHNVRSHAHSRAFNRAVSNLVGFGEVSAEEADRHEHPARGSRQPSATPARGRSDGPISDAQAKRLYAISRHYGWSDEEIRRLLQEEYGLSSSREIRRDQYDAICQRVESGDGDKTDNRPL